MKSIRAPYRLAIAGMAIASLATFVLPAAAVSSRPEVLRRHAKLLNSKPAARETLKASPMAIRLWFSEPVETGLSRIKLVGAGGTTFATGRARKIPGADESTLMAPVTAPLPAGSYRVQWAVASDDGHPMKGSYSFTVAPRP
jgi:copper resistance protein C